MAINSSISCLNCDLPIEFDTYKGCSHACKYCFVKRKIDIANIKKLNTSKHLEGFVQGKRTPNTMWADWDIPLRWGANSDPFQPAEAEHKESLRCLEILKKYQYPFVFCTKGKLCVEQPYFNLIRDCKCVVQLSLCCSKYDAIEQGCSPFDERIKWIKKFTDVGKRVVVRCQPYVIEVLDDVLKNIPRYAEYGAYGMTLEGLRIQRNAKNFVRIGGIFKYGYDVIRPHFERIRATCHKYGLVFLSGEPDVMVPDTFECCGTEGLSGFNTNKFHLARITHNCAGSPSCGQKAKGSALAFQALHQFRKSNISLHNASFEDYINKKTKG